MNINIDYGNIDFLTSFICVGVFVIVTFGVIAFIGMTWIEIKDYIWRYDVAKTKAFWLRMCIIPVLAVGIAIECFVVNVPVTYMATPKPIIETLNEETNRYVPNLTDIQCPTLPDGKVEQYKILKDKQNRIACSWKYNGKTINGTIDFNFTNNGTVTFIDDNNTAWCPIDWEVGDDCIPITKE